jgi:hypothetical protein
MVRSASILSTLLLQLACGVLPGADLETPVDDVRRVAQDLRWSKQHQASATIDVTEFVPPVAILAVPPGMHTLREIELLFSAEAARECVRRMAGGQPLTTDTSTLYICSARQITSSFFHDDASVPKPVALWKESPGNVAVLLERQGDEVQIVGLR